MLRRLRNLLLMPLDPLMGAVFCGVALLAVWTAAVFAPSAGGPLGAVLHKPHTLPEGSHTRLLYLAFVPYVIGYRAVAAAKLRHARVLIMAFAAVMAAVLVAKVLPFISHDIFIYAFQGRAVAVHGVNPYAVLPREVADPYVTAMGEWLSGLKDTYGPLWTDVTALVARAAGNDPVSMLAGLKGVAAAFFLASVPLAAALIDARVRRPKAERDALVLLYAWNPALLFEFAGNGHNDSAMIFFLLLAVLLAERRRLAFAGLAFAGSVLMKHMPVLALPFFLSHAAAAGGPRTRDKAVAAATFAVPMGAAFVVFYAPDWIGAATFGGLVQQSTHAGIDISSPLAFAIAYLAGGRHRVLSPEVLDYATPLAVDAFAAAMLVLTFVAVRRRVALARGAFAPIVAYLVLACTWFMPWYLAWLAPLFVMEGAAVAAIAASAAGIFLYQAYYTAPVLAVAAAFVFLEHVRPWRAPRATV